MARQLGSISKWMLVHDKLAKAMGYGVVSMVLVSGVLFPGFGRTIELNRKIETRSKEKDRLVSKVEVLSGIDVEALSELLEVLDGALPPRKDVVLYLATVDGLSRELGLSFAGISLSPGDVTEASASSKVRKSDIVKGVHVLETEIKINGSRDKIYEFLKSLESTSPLMQIKDVQISSLGSGEDSYALSLRLGMLWASRNKSSALGVVELFTEKEEKYFRELSLLRKFDAPIEVDRLDNKQLGKYNLFAPIPLQLESPQQQPQAQE